MLKKGIRLFLFLTLLIGSVVPNEVVLAEKKKSATTVEWLTEELGKRSKQFDPTDIPRLSEQKISEMTWDQLPLEDVKNIHYLYDRPTLQIAAYFYSNLERLLSYEEMRETYEWNDKDVMNKISKLPQEQLTFLFTYTPAIAEIYQQAKNELSAKLPYTTIPAVDSLPSNVKYTEKDQKWNYENRNVRNPVDDLYRSANLVEQDLVLQGKHGMDLVLERTYSSLNSKVLFPGYGENDNVTYSTIFQNDHLPFAAGWEFNIPTFSYSNYDLTTKLESFPSMERYSREGEHLGDSLYKWFVKLDDGTSLETQGTGENWRNYAYKGIYFQYASDGTSAKLTKNGITYEYRYRRAIDDGITITKTNPQGDRITYFLPNKTGADIEITDTVGRLVLLKKNGPYSSISDLEVYADSTKSQLLKRIHYGSSAMGGSGIYYVQLDQVTEISPTNESKLVSQYQYHDPSVKGRAEFNFERSYELPKTNGRVDMNGIESQTYIDRDNRYRKEIRYLLMKEASYPIQGVKMNYKYATYNKDASMLARGVVRQYQDDYAITYVSYHPVTSVTFSYMPMNPSPIQSNVVETSYNIHYEMLSTEIWKTPKSDIPRLADVANRNGDKMISKQQPTGQPGLEIEKHYQLNPHNIHVLSLIKQKAEQTATTITDGSKEYSYVPITYTSFKYINRNTDPTYQFTFVDPQGGSVNQSVYDYLLHRSSQRPTESEINKYANQIYREYNQYGDLILERDAQGNSKTWEYYLYDNQIAPKLRLLTDTVTQAYNDTGHKRTETFTYNSDYLLSSATSTDSYPGSTYTDKIVHTYSYQNKLLSRVREDSFGAEQKTKTQTISSYDPYGLYPTNVSVGTKLGSGQSETTLTTTFTYDKLGQLVGQGYPDGSQATYSYDVLGRLTKDSFVASTGERRQVTYEYDDTKRKVTQSLPDGTQNVTVYTPFGDIEYQAQIGTNGRERPLHYQTFTIDGKHVDKIYPYALPERRISYSYNPDGSLYSKTDPIGVTLYGRTNVSVDGSKYLPEQVSVTKQPNGLEQYIFTDRYGNQVKSISKTGDGQQEITISTVFDGFRNPVQKTERSQSGDRRTWEYQYDLRGRPIAITDPEANEYQYEYDSLGNLISVDENGTLTTRYAYNSLSWLLGEEYLPSRKKESYSYDTTGNRVQFVDKAGNRHDYAYTPFYDLASITTRNASGSITNNESWEYKTNTSLVSKHTNSNGAGTANSREISYTYDPFQRLTTQKAFNRTYEMVYTDDDDKMDQFIYPDNTTVTYRYDAAGRLSRVSSSLTGSISYDYNTSRTGETVTMLYPNGTETERKFNSFGQIDRLLHSQDGNTTWSESNAYNLGNVISINRNGTRLGYEYDKIDRLKKENLPGRNYTYAYDDRGNRQTYDGPLPEDSSQFSYTFDERNRLRGLRNETTNDSLDYTYYADGLRATKKENGVETRYVYVNGVVVEELDGSNRVKAQNIWGNELLFRKDTGSNQEGYYSLNSHGDVVAITDSAGNILNQYEYDSWGNVTSRVEGMNNPFLYSGEIYDEKAGLYYLRARYYDPSVGRFISEDTYKGAVDNPLSLNRYAYVHNNPLRFVDPSGHTLEEGTGGIGGFTSPIEEYLHWARVAASKAYAEGIEPEDAVRKYVPTQYQKEVLPTAIVTFNTAVGINHGDAPDLGLVAPAAGVAVAGTIKNTGKSVTKGTSKFTEPWIQKDTFKYITDKFGKNATQKFVDAMKKGVVGPKGQEGIKQLSKVEKKNGVIYTHEIKVLDNELGDYRIYGRFDKDRGQYIFDWFGKGKH